MQTYGGSTRGKKELIKQLFENISCKMRAKYLFFSKSVL